MVWIEETAVTYAEDTPRNIIEFLGSTLQYIQTTEEWRMAFKANSIKVDGKKINKDFEISDMMLRRGCMLLQHGIRHTSIIYFNRALSNSLILPHFNVKRIVENDSKRFKVVRQTGNKYVVADTENLEYYQLELEEGKNIKERLNYELKLLVQKRLTVYKNNKKFPVTIWELADVDRP